MTSKMTLRTRCILVFLIILSIVTAADAKKHSKSKRAAAPAPVINIPITGTSTDPDMPAFEAHFTQFMKKWRVPGAAVAVVKHGELVADRGYGWADKDAGETISSNSLFRVASVSKTFTAVTVLKLVQDGRLKLDDRVFNILNDLKPLGLKPINPQVYQITVQNLLQMASGWQSGSSHMDPMFGPWSRSISSILNPELPASCETITRLMMTMPLRYKPGTNYDYSNLDYCVLGLVINKVTGSHYGYEGYEKYVSQQILAPLGIHDMVIGSTQLQYRKPNEVHYYAPGPQEVSNTNYFPYSDMEVLKKNFSNGGWLATAKDLAEFIHDLYVGQILNQAMLKTMQAKPSFQPSKKEVYYTMGGIILNRGGQRYWIQHGSFTGTNALIMTKPNGTTVAIIFNYRPDAASLFGRFRPELQNMIINSDL